MIFQIPFLSHGYRANQFTPLDVVRELAARCDAYPDPAVWITRVPFAQLEARATALMADPAARLLPLYGIPFAVKDNIDTAGLPTTAACPAFAYQPAEDATVVAKLLAAGAILAGKTNLDQFAAGLVGTRSPYGAPSCVFDADYISGGSSSGSAVAVAANLVAFALGTDTAGSGRVPAGFNNIVGVKPSCGWLSTHGVVPAARSLDCVSVFASTAGEAMEVARIAAGPDPRDAYSRVIAPRCWDLQNPKLGVLALDQCHPASAVLYEEALSRAAALGCQLIPIDFAPLAEAAAALYGSARVAERLAHIDAFAAARPEALDAPLRSVLADAAHPTAVEAYQIEHKLQQARSEAARLFDRIDALLLPTAPGLPTKAAVAADPIGLNRLLGRYTNFVNLLDLAAIAVPSGFTPNKLPFGITLIGASGTDGALSVLGDRLHRATNCGAGGDRAALDPALLLSPQSLASDFVTLAVVGAHLSGQPLHHQLTGRHAFSLGPARTAPGYRLFALPNTTPPKPGLLREPGFEGPGIALELWAMSHAAFGSFVSQLPPPMAIGSITLDTGAIVHGFLCEPYACRGADDITGFGGWAAYLGSLKQG